MNHVADIWRVRGLYGFCFASKENAESAAREEFPDEAPDLRYSRIHFIRLMASPAHERELARRLVCVRTMWDGKAVQTKVSHE